MRRGIAWLGLTLIAGAACGDGDGTTEPVPREEPPPEGLPTVEGSWTGLPALPMAVYSAGAAWHRGALWVAGGFDASRSGVDEVWIWRPGSGAWEAGPALPRRAGALGLVSVGDSLYFVGGQSTELIPADRGLWVLGPDAQAWAGRPSAPADIERATFAGVDDGLLAFRSDGEVWFYDISAGSWSQPGTGAGRFGAAAATLGQRVYVSGGLNGTDVMTVWDADRMEVDGGFFVPEGVFEHGSGAVAGRVHLIGGSDSGTLTTRHRVLDPETGTWFEAPDLPGARAAPAVASGDGTLYVVGGRTDAVSAADARAHSFTPGS